MSDHVSGAILDVLSEAVNLGAAHMATTLSQFTGETVHLTAPRAMVFALSDLGDLLPPRTADVLAMFSWVRDNLSGLVCTVFSTPETWRHSFLSVVGADDEALPEIANILAGSFVRVLADLTECSASMLPPGVAHVPQSTALETVAAHSAQNEPLVILTAALSLAQSGAEARVLYVPDPAAVATMAELLR